MCISLETWNLKLETHGSLISQGTSENWELGNMKKSILTKNHTGKSPDGPFQELLVRQL